METIILTKFACVAQKFIFHSTNIFFYIEQVHMMFFSTCIYLKNKLEYVCKCEVFYPQQSHYGVWMLVQVERNISYV